MRQTLTFVAALLALAALSACGTKTPLTLPPQAQPATANSLPPAPDHNNKTAESRP